MAYENFGGFTKVDPDGELTVTANKVHVIDQDYDGDSRVYKDFGEDYFNGDFIHKFELTVTDGGEEPSLGIWALSNVSTGYDGMMMEETIIVLLSDAPSEEAGDYLLVFVASPDLFGVSIDLSFNTKYYLTIERNGTTHTLTIRTGSHTGDVVDVIEGLCVVAPFRYLYVQFEEDIPE